MGPKKRGDRKRKATETEIEPDESGGGEPSDRHHHCNVSKGNLTGKKGKNKYIGAHVSISGNTQPIMSILNITISVVSGFIKSCTSSVF